MTDIWSQINFYPGFVSADPDREDVKAVDHVDHIANVTGHVQYVCLLLLPKKRNTHLCAGSVGIASDYDSIENPVHSPYTSCSDTETL